MLAYFFSSLYFVDISHFDRLWLHEFHIFSLHDTDTNWKMNQEKVYLYYRSAQSETGQYSKSSKASYRVGQLWCT